MKKIFVVVSFLSVWLSACGGGGSSSPGENSAQPTTEINVATAFKNFIDTEKTTSGIPSLTANGGTATLIVRSEEAITFVANGTSQPVASAKVVQFQRINTGGKLSFQTVWKINFDAESNPVGMAIGDQFSRYNECMTVKTKNNLPSLSGATGVFFSGAKSVSYAEEFRAGNYAHYCDPTLDSNSSVEWAVVMSGDKVYACTIFPELSTAPKTRVCQQSSPSGAVGASIWISVFDSNKSIIAEYKS